MAATIFQGNAIKLLKSQLKFKDSDLLIITNDADDPTVVAKSAPAGSIYIRSATDEVYVKQDAGSSTNWTKLVTDADYTNLVTGAGVSTDNALAKYNGTTGDVLKNSLVILDDLGNMTGVATLAVANFDLTTNTISITNTDGDLNLDANGTGQINALADFYLNGDAVNALQAVTKQQLDAASGGVDVKQAVLVATTANITLSGEQTIDGVLTSASRVLVKNQNTQTENGIYVSDAGAWSRAADANTGVELENALVTVKSGTAQANTGWYQTSDSITIGVTNIVWEQFFGAGTYTADGLGIELSGSTFQLELDGSTLSKSSSGLRVASGGITNTEVNASAAIAYSKLNLSGSIVNADVNASAAIAYSKLNLSGSIVDADVNASAAIAYSKLNLSSSIVDADVAAGAAITRSKLASTTANRIIVNNGSGVLSDGSAITAARALISDVNGIPTHSTVTDTELGYVSGVTSAIQTQLDAKLTDTLASANIFVGNASNEATAVAVSGDLTLDNTGNAQIATGVIVNADVNASAAIARSKLASGTANRVAVNNGSGVLSDAAAITAARALISDANGIPTHSTVTDTELGYVSGVTSAIQTQIDGKLDTGLTSANIFVGNASNDAVGVPVTGDITLDNTGDMQIATGAIVNADVNAAAAIAYSKLDLANSIVNADINASAAIAYSKLNLSSSIVNADVATGAAIARSKLASGTANRVAVNDGSGVLTDAAAITASRALISDANGIPTHSTVTSTELGYVSGITSAIQTQLDSKVGYNTTTKTANYTAVAGDTVLVDTTGGAVTITLPAPASNIAITVKDKGAAETNNIIIDTPGSETIDGAAQYTINSNYGSVLLVSDGTNWFIL